MYKYFYPAGIGGLIPTERFGLIQSDLLGLIPEILTFKVNLLLMFTDYLSLYPQSVSPVFSVRFCE